MNENEERLVALMFRTFMSGLVSGYSTALINGGVPEELADKAANHCADQVVQDDNMVRQVLQEISELAAGQNTGPRTVAFGETD